MSAANYKTMENFPLLAREFVSQEKICSVCGAYQTDKVRFVSAVVASWRKFHILIVIQCRK